MTLLPTLSLLGSPASAAPLDPLAYASLGTLNPTAVVNINSTTRAMTGGATFTGRNVGGVTVFTFDTVTIDQQITITGDNPVAILSRGAFTLDARIQAVGVGSTGGPAGFDGGTFDGDDGDGPAGGVGSSAGGGGGGFGGTGGAGGGGASGGAPAYGDLLVSLEGGSGGGRCVYYDLPGNGGGGGGVVELGAVGALTVTAAGVVDVTGAAGADDSYDGGGGGAGGGILVHGVGGVCSGQFLADGGDGGDSSFYGYGGGGGGGGRITIEGLASGCTRSVTGGTAGTSSSTPSWDGVDGAAGVSLFDPDADADGWTVGDGDCDEGNALVYPGRAELAGDNLDSNCDNVEDCFVDSDDDAARTTVVDPGGSVSDADCNDANEGLATDPIDCDDTATAIRPGVAELTADGIDQNCDGVEDCFFDGDNDGARTTAVNPGGDNDDADCRDAREGGSADLIDCNDGDAAIEPEATEVAGDGIDQNCDTLESCFVDSDRDGARSSATVLGTDLDCTDPGEALEGAAIDCLDSDAAVLPGAPERTGDNVDQNCDLVEDCYFDADNDGARTSTTNLGGDNGDIDCNDAREGVAADVIDCNDALATIRPGLTELVGDNVDQNCDAVEDCFVDDDDDDARTTASDVGGTNGDADCNDAQEGVVADPIDCDDLDRTISPSATELPGDNVDQDCDLVEDCFTDADDDGARTGVVDLGGSTVDADCNDRFEGLSSDPLDCRDDEPESYPGAIEVVGSGLDEDCDGSERCFVDLDLDGARGTTEVQSVDADCSDDGEASASADLDCDDADDARAPAWQELGCSGVDEDCDPATNDTLDGDGDSVTCDLDCDDADADVSPLETELECNGVDDDCDPATGGVADLDSDGFTCDDDCDDIDATVNPGVVESTCDDLDNDCSAGTPDRPDADGDGLDACDDCIDDDPHYPIAYEVACNRLDDDCDPLTLDGLDEDGDGVAACAGDCNDLDATVYPGRTEVYCNSVDDDCDYGVATVDNPRDQDGDGLAVCAGDCDDLDPTIPAEEEDACTVADDDCDPETELPVEDDEIPCNGVDDDCNEDTPDDDGCTLHSEEGPVTSADTGSPTLPHTDEPGVGKAGDPGCNCATSGAPGAAGVWLGLGLLALRRARRTSAPG